MSINKSGVLRFYLQKRAYTTVTSLRSLRPDGPPEGGTQARFMRIGSTRAHHNEVWLSQQYASCPLLGPIHILTTAGATATAADDISPAAALKLWQTCVCCMEREQAHICSSTALSQHESHTQQDKKQSS